MDWRFAAALGLCAVVWIVWFQVAMPAIAPPPPKGAGTEGKAPEVGPPTTTVPGPAPGEAKAPVGPPPDGGTPPAPAPPRFPRTEVLEERTVDLPGESLDIRATNRGAALLRVTLPRFRNPDQTGPHDLLAPIEEGRPPGRLRLLDPNEPDLFQAAWETLETAPGEAAFAFRTGTGIRVEKRFAAPKTGGVAEPGAYEIGIRVRLENADSKPRTVAYELEAPAGMTPELAYPPILPFCGGVPPVLTAGLQYLPQAGRPHDERYEPRGVPQGERIVPIESGASLRFVGETNAYFVAALVPAGPFVREVVVGPVFPPSAIALERERAPPGTPPADLRRLVGRAGGNSLAVAVRTREASLPPGGAVEHEYKLVVCPKTRELLEAEGLDSLRAAGMFDWIAQGMLATLKFFRSLAGNYGIAIILLTILVRGCLHPLMYRQSLTFTRYGKRVQEIQPKLEAIKKQIKDPAKQLQKQRELMREHKLAPPLGGCAMLLVQFPIFVALYSTFLTSVELRHARFLWITDLSQPDRLAPLGGGFCGITHLNALPILWIVLIQLQQKIVQPASEQMTEQMRQQMGMMKWMTAVFGLLYYNVAAGAGLYVMTSTLIGMGEQWMIRRKLRRMGELPPKGTPFMPPPSPMG
ncbi:MAG: membrane protein insertase YidC [Planctomycetales bacterium]|nr:membrane protein insertase YidC [Planctomycetales bacterium]